MRIKALIPSVLVLAAWSTTHATPNLVVFLTDDLGGRDTSVYGSPDVRTPNIERLLAGGMTVGESLLAPPAGGAGRGAPPPRRHGAEPRGPADRPDARTKRRRSESQLPSSRHGLPHRIAPRTGL